MNTATLPDITGHRGRIGFDGHEWDCWIAPHYPEDRVIDSLETIHALARMAAGWR